MMSFGWSGFGGFPKFRYWSSTSEPYVLVRIHKLGKIHLSVVVEVLTVVIFYFDLRSFCAYGGSPLLGTC